MPNDGTNETGMRPTPDALVSAHLDKLGVGRDEVPGGDQEPVGAPVVPQPPPRAPGERAAPAYDIASVASAAIGEPVDLGEAVAPAAEEPAGAAEPATPDPDADMPPEARTDPRKRDKWAALKRELAQAQALAEERAKKLKDKDAEFERERTELQSKISKYDAEIAKLDLSRSPAFRAKYVEPIAAVSRRTVQLLTEAGNSEEEAQGLLNRLVKAKSMNEVQELVEGQPPVVQGAVAQSYVELKDLVARHNAALEDAKTTKPALDSELKQVQEAERIREAHELSEAALEVLGAPVDKGGEGSFLFFDQPAVTGWNEKRQEMVSSAKAILRDGDMNVLARAALEYVAAPVYRDIIRELTKKLQDAQRGIAARRAASPGQRGGGAAVFTPAPAAKPVRETLEQALAGVGED